MESTSDHNKALTDLLNGTEFKTMREDGDVDKAFEDADQVVERVYEAPFLPHNCMEPMNFYADVTDIESTSSWSHSDPSMESWCDCCHVRS